MPTSLALQLSQIASTSTHSLNLKAQRKAHSQSLIFEPDVAARQDFTTIFLLCVEGFQELCLLDRRFIPFKETLFSDESKDRDRLQLTFQENAELDQVIEDFLGLIGGRLLLKPATRAVEWIIRRFRAHEHNTIFLLLTFLPYHTAPVFRALLAILPRSIPPALRFIHPYRESNSSPPRRAIVYSLATNHAFSNALNSYVLRITKSSQQHHALMVFWSGNMAEATSAILDLAKSGRRNVQTQNEHDVLIRIIPVLNEGLVSKRASELRSGCYMILAVIVTKASLDDTVIIEMMKAVVAGWTMETALDGLICLALLAERRSSVLIPRPLAREIMALDNLPNRLTTMSQRYRVGKLTSSLILHQLAQMWHRRGNTTLKVIEDLLLPSLLTHSQILIIVKALLLEARKIDVNSDQDEDVRTQLSQTLVRLSSSSFFGGIVSEALNIFNEDVVLLERKLQIVFPRHEDPHKAEFDDDQMRDVGVASNEISSLDDALAKLPLPSVDEVSFLSKKPSHLYNQLISAFLQALASGTATELFSNISALRPDSAMQEPLYFTFFIRVWCGPYTNLARSTALRVVATFVSSQDGASSDLQALIPYIVMALADPAKIVRRAAAQLLLACNKIYSAMGHSDKPIETMPWAGNNMYGTQTDSKVVVWLSRDDARQLISELFVPDLEECILDCGHVQRLLQNAITSSTSVDSMRRHKQRRLFKSAQRTAFFIFLAGHTIMTPLLAAKLFLLKTTYPVRKVGKVTRASLLLPLLQFWLEQDSTELSKACDAQHILLGDLDHEMVRIVDPRSVEGLAMLRSTADGSSRTTRPTLVKSIFSHLRLIWPSLKEGLQLSLASWLLNVSCEPNQNEHKNTNSGEEAAGCLRSIELFPVILASLLEEIHASEPVQKIETPAKRRRIDHDHEIHITHRNTRNVLTAVRKLTFVLEMIESSIGKFDQRLMRKLFDILELLRRLKAEIGSEMAYIQSIVLRSVRTMAQAIKKLPKCRIEADVVRADILVDCVRSTISPQLQNEALLLVATLADVAPELVLHNIMPIFTFVGPVVLRQDDEFSVHAIDETITHVIPPLMESFRRNKQDPVAGTADLLWSLTAAFEHVPSHRRLRLYTSLARTLGEPEFLFALLIMLADRYGGRDDAEQFAADLAGQYEPVVQLMTAVKYLNVLEAALQPDQTQPSLVICLDGTDGRDPIQATANLLSLLGRILSSPELNTRLIHQQHEGVFGKQVEAALTEILEKLLCLIKVKFKAEVHAAALKLLEAFLGLQPIDKLVVIAKALLERPSNELHSNVLGVLTPRLESEPHRAPSLLNAVADFLPQVSTMISNNASDIPSIHAAIACFDVIVEKYGKSLVDPVVAAMHIVADSKVLDHKDDRIQALSVLCLTSAVEALGAATVPIMAQALPKALEIFERSLTSGAGSWQLQNTVCSYLSAVLAQIPWIVTMRYLDTILRLWHKFAQTASAKSGEEGRKHVLQLMAIHVVPKDIFVTAKRTLADATTAGSLAIKQLLDLLKNTVSRSSQAVVVQNAHSLTEILLAIFDLRRLRATKKDSQYNADEIEDIESLTRDCTLKMVLKMNDTAFRPIFATFVEWATTSLAKNERRGRLLRLLTIYHFFEDFFSTLKSIVTSYASIILDSIVEILRNFLPNDKEYRRLWVVVLRTLRNCFAYDQDSFWQSPSRFSAIRDPLMEQLVRASDNDTEAVAAITELAAAADSLESRKEINATLLTQLKSPSPRVRLAAIRCEESLTARLGEDWLAMLPEMLPCISELQEDDDEAIGRETEKWVSQIEGILGESLDAMLR